jgi:Subtilisin inhibitor-like
VKRTARLGVSGLLLIALLAACGTALRSTPTLAASSITVAIEVKVVRPQPSDVRYSLRCNPTSGTLPLAARVCADIAAQPAFMLRPQPARVLCYSEVLGPVVTIRTTWQGRPSTFSGEPGCGWPGTSRLSIYYSASQHRR